jgi:hypothetical protein
VETKIYLGKSKKCGASTEQRNSSGQSSENLSFDPSFHMVKQDDFDSKWQLKAGFVALREPTIKKRKATTVPQTTGQREVHWNAPPEGAATAPDPKRQCTEQNTDRDGSTSEINNMLQHHEAIGKPPGENPQAQEDCQPPEKESAQTQE